LALVEKDRKVRSAVVAVVLSGGVVCSAFADQYEGGSATDTACGLVAVLSELFFGSRLETYNRSLVQAAAPL